MRVKKFQAATLPEALRAVKRELGPDAVILHSERIPQGGLKSLLGKDMIEVVAAVDGAARPASPRAKPAAAGDATATTPTNVLSKPVARAAPAAPTQPRPTRLDADPPIAAPKTSAVELSDSDWRREGTSSVLDRHHAEILRRASTSMPIGGTNPDGAAVVALQRELAALRTTLDRLTTRDDANLQKLAPRLFDLYHALIRQELEPDLAQALTAAVHDELSERALADPVAIDDSIRRHLQRMVPVSGPLRPTRGYPLVLFLIGPTGVGKTTTLAKLAANYAFDRQRVVLVTTDSFRVAAIPQLETYAEILGIPVEVVYTPGELRDLVQRRSDCDVILVDTPGRSQHNGDRLAELRGFVDAIPSRSVWLTVSAATRYRDMRDIVDRFGAVQFDGLVLTKLDETATYGPIVNLVRWSGKPLTYLTTGQNVPTDIELATSERIAWLVTEDPSVGASIGAVGGAGVGPG